MRFYLFVLTALISQLAGVAFVNAQQRVCATMEVHQHLLDTDPEYAASQARIENEISVISGSAQRTSMTVTIPVVFHILYSTNNSTENISTDRIQDQLLVLNRDFSATNTDISQVPAAFQSLIGNSNIQFCLAQRDPNGNATNGIIRKQTSVTSFSSNNGIKFNSSGGSDAWPRDQYLNIWVGNLGGGLLGYAQFPGGTASTDGVVLLNASVGGPNFPGTISNYNIGRTATHEIGHWLNLRHIWGDANCGNDFVSDTPTQQTANYGCPSFPHVTCNNGPNGDMFMNYMDYVNDNCMVMFSAGQGVRMNAAITASRASLLTSLGCVPPAIAPVANFQASSVVTCKGQSVTFTDLSQNTPSSWSWTFPGGTPSASSAQNPVVTYNTVGTYSVSLTVTNSAGTDSKTLSGYITVNALPQVTVTAPGNANIVCAGSALTLTANSVSSNLTYQWTRFGTNISGATAATYNVTQTGNYKVVVTKPNGCSRISANYRVDKVLLPVVQIFPQGPTTFCPGDSVVLDANQNSSWTYVWKKYTNVIPGANTSQLVAKTSGLYKVVVTDTNGCASSSPQVTVNANCRITAADGSIDLFPNPVQEFVNVSLNMPVAGDTPLLVYDAIGRLVLSDMIPAEESSWTVPAGDLSKGVYMIVLALPDGNLTSRFVKQ